MQNLRKFTVIGILFVSAAGTLLHFVYAWSGQNPLVGFFAPGQRIHLGAYEASVFPHAALQSDRCPRVENHISFPSLRLRGGDAPGASSDSNPLLHLQRHSGLLCPAGGHRHLLCQRDRRLSSVRQKSEKGAEKGSLICDLFEDFNTARQKSRPRPSYRSRRSRWTGCS